MPHSSSISIVVSSGSVYVYYSSNGVSGWSQTSKLIASDGATNDYFGDIVAVSSNIIAVGASRDDTSAGNDAGKRLINIYAIVLYYHM